jgi:hypothetical protein
MVRRRLPPGRALPALSSIPKMGISEMETNPKAKQPLQLVVMVDRQIIKHKSAFSTINYLVWGEIWCG